MDIQQGIVADRALRALLYRILGDGEWHTFDELYYALESRIPPEAATRRYLRSLRYPERDATTDIDEQIRQGKEQTVISAISNLRCEQRGFKERRKRSYRLDPAEMRESANIRRYAQVPFRALMAHPGIAQFFRSVYGAGNLNPSQAYWVDFANDVLASEPEEEAADGETERGA